MAEKLPIDITSGVTLIPKSTGICTVSVSAVDCKNDLSWDRYVRLRASAEAVLKTDSETILDAGGYDGALGFFLPNKSIDLIDPATTGGSVLEILADDDSYDAVVAVDVLEHIEPDKRALAISEFARVAKKHVILNYPCLESMEAQKLVYKLTGNGD